MSKVSEEFVVPVAVAHTFSSSSLESEVVDLRGKPGKPYLENKERRRKRRRKRRKKKGKRRKRKRKKRGEGGRGRKAVIVNQGLNAWPLDSIQSPSPPNF